MLFRSGRRGEGIESEDEERDGRAGLIRVIAPRPGRRGRPRGLGCEAGTGRAELGRCQSPCHLATAYGGAQPGAAHMAAAQQESGRFSSRRQTPLPRPTTQRHQPPLLPPTTFENGKDEPSLDLLWISLFWLRLNQRCFVSGPGGLVIPRQIQRDLAEEQRLERAGGDLESSGSARLRPSGPATLRRAHRRQPSDARAPLAGAVKKLRPRKAAAASRARQRQGGGAATVSRCRCRRGQRDPGAAGRCP